MKKHFFTFGFNHYIPNNYSNAGKTLGNYYVVIEAECELTATKVMNDRFGERWSMQYTEKEFEGQILELYLTEFEYIQQKIN